MTALKNEASIYRLSTSKYEKELSTTQQNLEKMRDCQSGRASLPSKSEARTSCGLAVEATGNGR